MTVIDVLENVCLFQLFYIRKYNYFTCDAYLANHSAKFHLPQGSKIFHYVSFDSYSYHASASVD